MQSTIQAPRLTLVPMNDDHLEHEIALDARPEVMRFLGNGVARERAEVEKHHNGRLKSARDGLGYWTGFVGTQFVGWWLLAPAGNDERGQAEIGYRLSPDFWRQGFASEGAKALLAYGFDELSLTQIFAETMTINEGSRAVLSRLGMSHLRTRDVGQISSIPESEQGNVDYVITKKEWEKLRSAP